MIFCTPIRVFRRLSWVLPKAAAFLVTSSPAEPVPLPDWVKPIESSLPKVTPELISEVDDIYWSIAMNSEYIELPGRKEKVRSNVLRLIELREQAGQAMLWQNFKRYALGGSPWPGMLNELKKNRELAAWLLPIIRFRMDLYALAIQEQKLNEFYLSQKGDIGHELSEMREYLVYQGERSDIENLYRIYEEFSKIGYDLHPKTGLYLPDYLKEMEEVRKLGGQADQPYWKSVAQTWISRGVLTADVLRTVPPASNTSGSSNHPKPLGPRQSLSQGPKPRSDENQEPWTPRYWPTWVLIGLAGAGLLWLLVKRKPLTRHHP